jgi:hypothetical protein
MDMQKVHCIDQAYWIVTRRLCPCGTAYSRRSVIQQSVEEREGVPVDVLTVRCPECGDVRDFTFDISSFFRKPDLLALDDLIGNRKRVFDMYYWSELKMASAHRYLRELAESGDAVALEYIADAARHFVDKAQAHAAE